MRGKKQRKSDPRMMSGATLVKILVLVAVILLIVGGYFLGKSGQEFSTNNKAKSIAGWQSYTAPELGYSFQYPPDWDTYSVVKTLAVGPKNAIDELRELDSRGGGYDSPYMAMQIDVRLTTQLEGSFTSDETQSVESEKVMLNSKKATKHMVTYIQSLPGVDEGTQSIFYAIPLGPRVVVISLLDLRYKPMLEQIVSTFTFSDNALVGKTTDEIQQEKGSPTDTSNNTQTGNEVWVYGGKGEDPTAQYIYFENGYVVDIKNDEYNGDLSSDPWIQ